MDNLTIALIVLNILLLLLFLFKHLKLKALERTKYKLLKEQQQLKEELKKHSKE